MFLKKVKKKFNQKEKVREEKVKKVSKYKFRRSQKNSFLSMSTFKK